MLIAATALIAEKGAAGTSLADIGLAAGYSRGLPSSRYGTKLALLEALIDAMDDWFEAQLEAGLAGKTGMAAVFARLDVHFDAAVREPMGTAALYAMFAESFSGMPELRPRVRALLKKSRQGLTAALRAAQRQGELGRDVDCARHGALIIDTISGFILQSLISGKPENLRRAKSEVLRLFGDVLGPPPDREGTDTTRRQGRRKHVEDVV